MSDTPDHFGTEHLQGVFVAGSDDPLDAAPLSETLTPVPPLVSQDTSDPTLVVDPAEPHPHWTPRDPHTPSALERAIRHGVNVLSWDSRLNAPDFHLAQDLVEKVEARLQADRDVEGIRRVITNPQVREMLVLQFIAKIQANEAAVAHLQMQNMSHEAVATAGVNEVLDMLNQLMDIW